VIPGRIKQLSNTEQQEQENLVGSIVIEQFNGFFGPKGKLVRNEYVRRELLDDVKEEFRAHKLTLELENDRLKTLVAKLTDDLETECETAYEVKSYAEELIGLRVAEVGELKAKLEWLTRWRLVESESCPFPPDTFVQYRQHVSGDEEPLEEPLKEMPRTCMVAELADSDEWRPHVECLMFYASSKDVPNG
jgi:hypothetical protein